MINYGAYNTHLALQRKSAAVWEWEHQIWGYERLQLIEIHSWDRWDSHRDTEMSQLITTSHISNKETCYERQKLTYQQSSASYDLAFYFIRPSMPNGTDLTGLFLFKAWERLDRTFGQSARLPLCDNLWLAWHLTMIYLQCIVLDQDELLKMRPKCPLVPKYWFSMFYFITSLIAWTWLEMLINPQHLLFKSCFHN